MVYREHGMWEVLEVLRRAHRGEGRRAIARTTGRTRKTVTRYLEAAKQLGWQPDDGEPGEPLAARILAQLRPGPRDRPPQRGGAAALGAPGDAAWLAQRPDGGSATADPDQVS